MIKFLLNDEQKEDLSYAIEEYLDANIPNTPPWAVQDLVNVVVNTIEGKDD